MANAALFTCQSEEILSRGDLGEILVGHVMKEQEGLVIEKLRG